ncbi:MAG TPA: hypothetical protein VF989_11320 [Polyangiaceae bacterium]
MTRIRRLGCALAFFGALASFGCQVVFGDFEVDDEAFQEATDPPRADPCDDAGERRCSGARLELCGDGEWELEEECSAENLCNEVPARCGSCSEVGSLQCNRSRLQRCSTTGAWTLVETCRSEEHCESALESGADDPASVTSC